MGALLDAVQSAGRGSRAGFDAMLASAGESGTVAPVTQAQRDVSAATIQQRELQPNGGGALPTSSVVGRPVGGFSADTVIAALDSSPAATKPAAAPARAPVAAEKPPVSWAEAFRNDPKGKGLPEAVASVGSGVAGSVLGGLHGLYKLATTGSLDEAAQAVRGTQDALTVQPETPSGKAAVEVVGSNYNPLNWPQAATKAAGNAAFEAGQRGLQSGAIAPENAGAVKAIGALAAAGEAASALVAPGAILKSAGKGTTALRDIGREAKPEFGSAGSAAATNSAAIKATAENASPELKAAIYKLKPNEINKKALERQAEADSMGIKLTEGQATGDVVTLTHEKNMRGKDTEYAYRFNEQNQQLKNKINEIRDEAAPDVYGVNHVENGQALIDAYKATDEAISADISAKYKALEDANGGNFPVDGVAFADSAQQLLAKKLKSDFVPAPIAKQLERFKAGEPMNFEAFEAMRTNLAAEMRKAERSGDGNAAMAAGLVREALESLPMSGETATLKPIADAARNAAKARFDLLKKDPAYKAAISDSVAADDFIGKFVINGKVKNIESMVEHLGEGSPAHQTMAAGVINYLKRQAGIVDESGNFSQHGYNKALENLRPKLNKVLNPKSAAEIETLGRVARYTQEQPTGSFVNNSNTFVAKAAEGAKSALEFAANKAVPYAQIGSRVREFSKRQEAEKQKTRSLQTGAGISLKDIGK